jgi:hypothetical protein
MLITAGYEPKTKFYEVENDVQECILAHPIIKKKNKTRLLIFFSIELNKNLSKSINIRA